MAKGMGFKAAAMSAGKVNLLDQLFHHLIVLIVQINDCLSRIMYF